MSGEGWKRYKLNELVDEKRGISYGIVQPGLFLDSGGVPILKVNNLTENRTTINDVFRVSEETEKKFERTRLQGNEILISLVGSLGYIFKTSEEQKGWNVVRAIGVLPIKENINRDWVYWCLKSPEVQEAFRNLATVTVQATLNLKELKEIEIPFPDIQTQTRIAAILSALDNKIELNHQTNATLEAIAQAIFKEWFVDFRFPGATGEMQDSELGPIPKGWRVGKIKDFTRTIQYGLTQSASTEEVGPHFLRITDIQNGRINWGSVPYCSVNDRNLEKYRIKDYDIFIARTGASTGENILVVNPPKAVFASYLIRIQFSQPELSVFIGKLLRSKQYFEFIDSIKSGSAQPNANAQQLTDFDIILPTFNILQAYYKTIARIEEIKVGNETQSATLTQIRDTLLPKLMNGEIPVGAGSKPAPKPALYENPTLVLGLGPKDRAGLEPAPTQSPVNASPRGSP